eukprot:4731962-Amphidinium_carterae.1
MVEIVKMLRFPEFQSFVACNGFLGISTALQDRAVNHKKRDFAQYLGGGPRDHQILGFDWKQVFALTWPLCVVRMCHFPKRRNDPILEIRLRRKSFSGIKLKNGLYD